MRLRPIEHLENRQPKCKMRTQERQLTRFSYFTTDLQENRTDGFSKPNRNWTEIGKTIPHIPKTGPNPNPNFYV